LAQLVCWRSFAAHIDISYSLAERAILIRMLRYCFFLGISTLGMLCVSGLDVTVVGHYDYSQTAYYAIAVLPTNMMLLIISSVIGPMMPASSALSTRRTNAEMGGILVATTRYGMIVLFTVSLPIIVFGFPLLKLWLGADYAMHSIGYLRVLVVANVLRNVCLPYSTMVVGTGEQRSATIAAIGEAIVNLASSVILANFLGASGVAYGTLIGACVSVFLHFTLSMRATNDVLRVSRRRLFLEGIATPSIVLIPTLLTAPLWAGQSHFSMNPAPTLLWAASTLACSWLALRKTERESILLKVSTSLRLESR